MIDRMVYPCFAHNNSCYAPPLSISSIRVCYKPVVRRPALPSDLTASDDDGLFWIIATSPLMQLVLPMIPLLLLLFSSSLQHLMIPGISLSPACTLLLLRNKRSLFEAKEDWCWETKSTFFVHISSDENQLRNSLAISCISEEREVHQHRHHRRVNRANFSSV